MSNIPSRCPKCGSDKWKEVINPFTSGIPIGQSSVRFSILSIRGLLARPIKKRLGFYRVKYRCKNCGFTQAHDLLR